MRSKLWVEPAMGTGLLSESVNGSCGSNNNLPLAAIGSVTESSSQNHNWHGIVTGIVTAIVTAIVTVIAATTGIGTVHVTQP